MLLNPPRIGEPPASATTSRAHSTSTATTTTTTTAATATSNLTGGRLCFPILSQMTVARQTPLHLACIHGHRHVVEWICQVGDPNQWWWEDAYGRTAE